MPARPRHAAAPAAASSTHTSAAKDSGPGGRFGGWRPEVQGLRAVAVLLVVVYHVFTDRVSGGVDIFLFISAFFLTLSFTRKLDGGRPLALGRYWLHVFTRLMPLAIVTILGTLLLVATVYPTEDRASWRLEGLASAAYVENWVLAFGAVDYYAADNSSMSPFQHFWSLSVQGQVFLIWPLVFALAAVIVRRTRFGAVSVLGALFGVIFAASLWWSVTQTAANQAFTYFDTRARLWEFALGSLVALATPYLRPPRAARLFLGWGGLLSMVAVGMVVDVEGAFPGWIALWPLLSAAAVIVAGTSGSRHGLDRILSSRPLTALGGSAYALYLVHWPLLITYAVLTGRAQANLPAGLAIIVFSVGLAILLTRLVERPMGEWTWPRRSAWRQAAVIGTCLALVAAPVGAWKAWDDRRREEVLAMADRNNPGAAALLEGFVDRSDTDADPIPVVSGRYPFPEYAGACPEEVDIADISRAACKVLVEGEDAAETVLMLGNSHVMQWSPAIAHWAEEQGRRVVSFTRGSCLLAPLEEQLVDNDTCPAWLDDYQSLIDWADPSIVFVQGTRSLDDGGEALTPGMAETIESLVAENRVVLGIRDNPRFGERSMAACARTHGDDSPLCTRKADYLVGTDPIADLAASNPGVVSLDMNDLICPEGVCVPVVGNVRLYWDNNHLTPDYVRSLAPMLAERAESALADNRVEWSG